MDLITLACIGSVAFILLMLATAFIRQFMLRHDTKSNDQAQHNALVNELGELEKIRQEMKADKRFTIHYEILSSNKDEIRAIDERIEAILAEKQEQIVLIARKSQDTSQHGQASPEKEVDCEQIGLKIAFYDDELKKLQERRAGLWGAQTEFQKHLLNQEEEYSRSLYALYNQHSGLFEVINLRHIGHTEVVAVKNIEASALTFKDILMAPIQFIMQCFGSGGRIPGGGVMLPNLTFVQNQLPPAPPPAQGPTVSEQAHSRYKGRFLPPLPSIERKKEGQDEELAIRVSTLS